MPPSHYIDGGLADQLFQFLKDKNTGQISVVDVGGNDGSVLKQWEKKYNFSLNIIEQEGICKKFASKLVQYYCYPEASLRGKFHLVFSQCSLQALIGVSDVNKFLTDIALLNAQVVWLNQTLLYPCTTEVDGDYWIINENDLLKIFADNGYNCVLHYHQSRGGDVRCHKDSGNVDHNHCFVFVRDDLANDFVLIKDMEA